MNVTSGGLWEALVDGFCGIVEGDVPLTVDIRFPVEAERWAAVSPGLTAHRAVNAVAYVCEALPGICGSVELPPIVPDLSGTTA